MKALVTAAIGGALVLAVFTTALASQESVREGSPAPAPAHGSVWFGSGLERYAPARAMPLHGSVWFGSGMKQYDSEEPRESEAVNIPTPIHGIDHFGSGLGH